MQRSMLLQLYSHHAIKHSNYNMITKVFEFMNTALLLCISSCNSDSVAPVCNGDSMPIIIL